MSFGSINDDVIASWLSALAGQCRFASVHYAKPTWTDPSASEVTDAGYTRQPVLLDIESERGIVLGAPLTFGPLAPMTVSAIGLWTDLHAGIMQVFCEAPPGNSLYIATSKTVVIPLGELAIRLP